MLQTIAAKKMLENPKRTVSATKIATEIICQYLKNLNNQKN